jgi:crotonobetainyl-CoA:carnitine CoA-transferase CaiB-like acyl-CoA transferase
LDLEGHPDWNATEDAFTARDRLGDVIAARIAERSVADWLSLLEPADIWCAEVLDWPRLMQSATFRALDMVHQVTRNDGVHLSALRGPLRIDGQRLPGNGRAAPAVGADSAGIRAEFGL